MRPPEADLRFLLYTQKYTQNILCNINTRKILCVKIHTKKKKKKYKKKKNSPLKTHGV